MQTTIVIGRNYTSRLGMIRALGLIGCDVHVIKTNGNGKDPDAYSKYVSGYHYAPQPDKELLIQKIRLIGSKCREKVVIVPVDDYAASTIDEHLDELKSHFLMPNIHMRQGAIVDIMDKDIQKELAIKSGLNVARGWVLDIRNGDYSIPADLTYPCFPKPQISFMGNKRCMKRCDNEADLRRIISEVAKGKNCPLLIEEYIKIEKEYATLGFSDGKTVVMPAMIQLLKDGSGPHKGVTLQGKITPIEQFKEFYMKLSDYITKIGFVGLFDIDSYESNGNLYFNELNLRFGASGFAITDAGVNLPKMLVDCLQNKEIDINQMITREGLFVNEKVAYEDMNDGYISYKEYKRYLSCSDYSFIKNSDDPNPYVQFTKHTKRHYKQIIKYILRCLKLK